VKTLERFAWLVLLAAAFALSGCMSPQAGMAMMHQKVTGPLGQAIDQSLSATGPAVSAYAQGYNAAPANPPPPPQHGTSTVWVGQGVELPQSVTVSY
jgi:hypothetical protein